MKAPTVALLAVPFLLLCACGDSGSGGDGASGGEAGSGGSGSGGSGGPGGSGGCVAHPEADAAACHDGLDDDCDGFVDCGDYSCTRGPAGNLCCEGDGGPERDDERCGNGIDDDCNGFVDCQDFACSARNGVTVCCGVDGQSVPEADDAACSNGWDDDCNGFTDCHDFACGASNGIHACCGDGGAEDTPERCGNGLDDDCNGYIDCKDFACSRGAAAPICCVPAPELDEAACSNGRDDDCDGRSDCDDEDCTSAPGRTFCLPPCVASGAEGDDAACSNGVDDDCDGYTDCVDFGCSQSGSVTVCGRGAAANCEPCTRARDCAGGECRHYTAIEGAASFCTSTCRTDADCSAGLSLCSGGFCLHRDSELTGSCSAGGDAVVWSDACGITHGAQPCAAGDHCNPAAAGEDDARCGPPCRTLGAIVDTTAGEACCAGLEREYDPVPAIYTERCLVGDGQPCAADYECAQDRSCLQGACTYCQEARACTSDADCCDGYGCNGGSCDQLCGSSCHGSDYVGGIFCYSSCSTRFHCSYECSDP